MTIEIPNNELVDTGDVVIPLEVNPRYDITYKVDGESYHFYITWNEHDQSWYLDLFGVSNGTDIKGIKLVSGVNLTKPFNIPNWGALYIIDQNGKAADPDYDNIGTRYIMYYVPVSNTEYII